MAALPVLVGSSDRLRELDNEITRTACSDAKVLITGESGVGKEVVARLVHCRSRRCTEPCVVINCAGVPETLLESEFFGHERGSFTGAHKDRPGPLELAHRGTVFLDEIGEMSLRMQGLLLRFLETGELRRVGGSQTTQVDVRMIVATNRNLEDEIERGAFREDLYYRLNVMHLDVPPLRERPHDVAPLVSHFLEMFSRQYNLSSAVISAEALRVLEAYDWPGNVRELRNVVERTLVRRPDGRITENDIPDDVVKRARPRADAAASTADVLFARMRENGESFWSVVFAPFQARDLSRADVREVLRRGLDESWGSYRGLLPFFNLEERDYRPFMRALRKHECHLPFQPFRAQHRQAARTRAKTLKRQGLREPRS